VIQDRDDTRGKSSSPFEERSQGSGGALSFAGDIAARFEAGADSFVGGGWAQHAPVLGPFLLVTTLTQKLMAMADR
jgi:hypothetical protein